MIITKDFIYLHMPKTGGTFVTDSLQRVYGNAGRSRLRQRLHNLFGTRHLFINIDKHGYRSRTHVRYRHLPLLACVRNPYDRYVSQYEFGWWKRYPEEFPGLREHADFPDLNFENFVTLANTKWLGKYGHETPCRTLGWHTIAFIAWYSRHPDIMFKMASDASDAQLLEALQKDLSDVCFLRTDRLNQDLHDYLVGLGLTEERIGFIRRQPKIFPREGGRTDHQKWENYYSVSLKKYIRDKERLIFALFPEFDI